MADSYTYFASLCFRLLFWHMSSFTLKGKNKNKANLCNSHLWQASAIFILLEHAASEYNSFSLNGCLYDLKVIEIDKKLYYIYIPYIHKWLSRGAEST